MTTQKQTVPLASIILDEKLWPRLSLDEDRVREFKELYQAEPDALPALEVVPVGNGKCKLADGWHRYHALLQLKRSANCVILPSDTDIYVYACKVSSVSSKPMTRVEKRKAALNLLKQHKEWSDREISRICGVSQPFVSKLRKSFVARTMTTLSGEASGSVSGAREKPSIAQSMIKTMIKFVNEYEGLDARVDAILDEIAEEDGQKAIDTLNAVAKALSETAGILAS